MEDLPLAEKEIPTYEGDSTHTMLQYPYQEVETEAEALIIKYSRRWKALDRALEIREQESFNWNTEFTSVQGQE